MSASLDALLTSIDVSATTEAECKDPEAGPSPPPPPPPPSPVPVTPPTDGFTLTLVDGTDRFLTLDGLGQHAKLHLGARCDEETVLLLLLLLLLLLILTL
jgi:hypothetical protein